MTTKEVMKEVIGDELFSELIGPPKKADPVALSKAMGVKTYSPENLVQTFLEYPEASLAEIAKLYGKTVGWVWACIASESFQSALDPHRHLIHNPSITLTFKERFQTVALHALEVLNKKLESSKVDDQTVLGAIGVSVKALGLNGKGDDGNEKPLRTRSIADLAGSMEAEADKASASGEGLGSIPQATVVFNPADYADGSAN
jgi:hypothetical protein